MSKGDGNKSKASPAFREAGRLNFLKGRLSNAQCACRQAVEEESFSSEARARFASAEANLRMALRYINEES